MSQVRSCGRPVVSLGRLGNENQVSTLLSFYPLVPESIGDAAIALVEKEKRRKKSIYEENRAVCRGALIAKTTAMVRYQPNIYFDLQWSRYIKTSLDVPIPYDQMMHFCYQFLGMGKTQICTHFLNAYSFIILFYLLKKQLSVSS